MRAAVLLFILYSQAGFACNADRVNSLSEAIPVIMSETDVVGLNVTLICDAALYWEAGFGTAGGERELSAADVFEAASNGKMITAYLVARLIENGQLDPEARIEDPRLVSACDPPTVTELLSHTAGLSNDIEASTFHTNCDQKGSFLYAGQGYLVLQHHLELMSGQPVNDLFRAGVFQPLGMPASTFAALPPSTLVPGHAELLFGLLSGRSGGLAATLFTVSALFAVFACLVWRFTRSVRLWVATGIWVIAIIGFLNLVLVALTQITVPIAGGTRGADLAASFKTNTPDLSRFVLELLDPEHLSPTAVARLFTPIVEVNTEVSWASGFGIDHSGNPPTVWHWGSNPGYQSLVVMEPQSRDAAIILTNTGRLLDYFLEDRGGHAAAKRIAALALNRKGRWDIN